MRKGTPRFIEGYSSIFLDSLRILAAFTVLYIHAFDRWFPTLAHDQNKPGEPSHAAVVVFFVLSGYVIAHTTISKNRGGMQYAQARLSRLCSIVIPALLITAVIQFIIANVNSEMLLSYTRGSSGIRYLMSALFVNEVWFFSAAPPLNGSLWSLSFEFWYYTVFGLWFFRSKGLKSTLMVIVACLIAGPKIMLMMPIWLLGYLAYSLPRPKVDTLKAWLPVFVFLLLAGLAVVYVPFMPCKVGYKPLYYANQFITDWIVGFFVAAALWILPTIKQKSEPVKLTNVFRTMADLTFPLYVLHFPLLILWRCSFGYTLNNRGQLWEAIIAVLIASGIIGIILEKQRFLWIRFFRWALNSVKTIFLKNSSV